MFRIIFFLEQHLLLPKNNPLIKENYDKILNNYKQLTLELKITDLFQLTYFLATLLGNGYLSYNKINNNSNPRIFSNEFNLYSPNNELLLDVADSSLNNILSFNKEEHIAFINNICDENFRLIYDAYINIQKELNIIKEESDRLILTRKK